MTQPAISNLKRVTRTLLGAAFALGLAQAAAAQSSPFAPVRIINDKVISQYELDQRVIFLTLLRQPGDPVEEALRGLTQDKLQLWIGEQFGVTVTPEQILAGMEEFAARANLTPEQFVEAIGQAGMDAESFRDFVKAGLVAILPLGGLGNAGTVGYSVRAGRPTGPLLRRFIEGLHKATGQAPARRR